MAIERCPTRPVDPAMPLLWALRDVLGLTGTKFGCGVAACGACTVHVDGQAVRSCVTPLGAVAGKRVATIEALGSAERPHPLQRAWVAAPGAAVRLLPERHADGGRRAARRAIRSPSDADIDAAITNICRCGTYPRIRAAIQARRALRGGAKPAAPAARDEAARCCSSAASARPARSSSAGACCRRAAGSARADALPAVDGEVGLNGWIKIARRRRRAAGDEPQRDGAGRAHRAADAGRRGARRAAGARAADAGRPRHDSTATSRCSSPSLPFHPRTTRPGHETAPRARRPVGRRQGRARARHQRDRRLVERRRRLGRAARWPRRRRARSCSARRRCSWKLPADELAVARRRGQPSVGPAARTTASSRACRRGDAARRRCELQGRAPTGR